MLQFRFYDNETFEFADYSQGSRIRGTYTVMGTDLVLQDKSGGKEQRVSKLQARSLQVKQRPFLLEA